ncbi:MAG: anti-sigma factor [Chitinophagaceae bacterium]
MNIQEYIESGIIESCVLGLATRAEQQQLESMCLEYPEINNAKKAFELALENQLMKDVVTPPAGLKEKVFLSLNMHGVDKSYSYKKENSYNAPVQRMYIWKWVAVASILLLLGSIYLTYSIRDEYQKLQTATNQSGDPLNDSTYFDAIMVLKPIVEKPSVKWSTMVEPTDSAHCMAHVYWDTLSTDTYLLIGNIPKPVSDKQFQLWEISGNRSVDLGVFDVSKEGKLVQMRNVNNAKDFVITIEPRGGSATPTLKTRYAIGKL